MRVIAWIVFMALSVSRGTAAHSCTDDVALRAAHDAIDASCRCLGSSSRLQYLRCVRAARKTLVALGSLTKGCTAQAAREARDSACGWPGAVVCWPHGTSGTDCRVTRDESSCTLQGGVLAPCSSCDGCPVSSDCGAVAAPACAGDCASGKVCQSVEVQGYPGCLCVPADATCETQPFESRTFCRYGTCRPGSTCASLLAPDGSGSSTCGCGAPSTP